MKCKATNATKSPRVIRQSPGLPNVTVAPGETRVVNVTSINELLGFDIAPADGELLVPHATPKNQKPFSEWKNAELKGYLKGKNIKVPAGSNKAALVALAEEAGN